MRTIFLSIALQALFLEAKMACGQPERYTIDIKALDEVAEQQVQQEEEVRQAIERARLLPARLARHNHLTGQEATHHRGHGSRPQQGKGKHERDG